MRSLSRPKPSTIASELPVRTSGAKLGIVTGDFDGDGLDLVTASYSGNTVSILLGNGDRKFDCPYRLRKKELHHRCRHSGKYKVDL